MRLSSLLTLSISEYVSDAGGEGEIGCADD